MTPAPTHFIRWNDGQLTPTNEETATCFNSTYKLPAKGIKATAQVMQDYQQQRPELFQSTNVDDY